MTYLVYIYNLILYQPLLNGLVLLYETVAFRDLGIAIILLTLLIRLLLYPLFHKSARHQAILQEIQPKLRELQEKHKDDYEARNRASLELFAKKYTKSRLLIQLVLRQILDNELSR